MSNQMMRACIGLTWYVITMFYIGGIVLNYSITARSHGWGAYIFAIAMAPIMMIISYRVLRDMRRRYRGENND